MRLRDVGVRVHIDKDLVAASSTPLVLAILAEGESYGYAILKRVRELSGGELKWTDGMLYPLLHRLLRLGYVTTEWRTPPEGRRRRYYAITDDGRAALADQRPGGPTSPTPRPSTAATSTSWRRTFATRWPSWTQPDSPPTRPSSLP